MGGTRVGEGLDDGAAARSLRAHVKHGAILLVSDLDDSNADQGRLEQEATAAAGGAHPGPDRAALRGAARPAPLRARSSATTRSSTRASSRTPQSAMRQRSPRRSRGRCCCSEGSSSLLLAGNERWNGRLAVEEPPREEAARPPPAARSLALALRRHRARFSCCSRSTCARGRRPSSRDDLRFRALPAHRGLWRPPTILPGDPAATLHRHRRHDRLPARAAVLLVQPDRQQPRVAPGHPDAARVGAGEAPGPDRRRRRARSSAPIAANLLGVLVVTTPAPGSDQDAVTQILTRAAQYFQLAIAIDPTATSTRSRTSSSCFACSGPARGRSGATHEAATASAAAAAPDSRAAATDARDPRRVVPHAARRALRARRGGAARRARAHRAPVGADPATARAPRARPAGRRAGCGRARPAPRPRRRRRGAAGGRARAARERARRRAGVRPVRHVALDESASATRTMPTRLARAKRLALRLAADAARRADRHRLDDGPLAAEPHADDGQHALREDGRSSRSRSTSRLRASSTRRGPRPSPRSCRSSSRTSSRRACSDAC